MFYRSVQSFGLPWKLILDPEIGLLFELDRERLLRGVGTWDMSRLLQLLPGKLIEKLHAVCVDDNQIAKTR